MIVKLGEMIKVFGTGFEIFNFNLILEKRCKVERGEKIIVVLIKEFDS